MSDIESQRQKGHRLDLATFFGCAHALPPPSYGMGTTPTESELPDIVFAESLPQPEPRDLMLRQKPATSASARSPTSP
jgi:hypothetical protein